MPLLPRQLDVEAGATYPTSGVPLVIRYTAADDAWTAKIQFRVDAADTGAPLLELTPTVAADGSVELLLTGEQTLTIAEATVWGCQFTGPTSDEPEIPVIGGKVKVKPWAVR